MSGYRLADAALRCYPAWWREIYLDEVGQLIDDLRADGGSEVRLATDLFRGALAARLWARAMPPRVDLWFARARASIAVATLPFIGTLPFVFFGLDANEGYKTLARGKVLDLVHSPNAQLARTMATLLHNGVLAGLIAALVGWFALFNGVRRARVRSASHPRLLVKLPLVFLAMLIGLHIARVTELPRGLSGVPGSPGVMIPHGGDLVAATALLDATWAVLSVGAAVTVFAIARVAKVCEVPWKTMVSGRRVAAVTTVVLGAMAACAAVGMAVSGPQGFVTRTMGIGRGNPHRLYTTYMSFPHWTVMAVPLAIAAVASFGGWRASRRAQSMLSVLDPGIRTSINGI